VQTRAYVLGGGRLGLGDAVGAMGAKWVINRINTRAGDAWAVCTLPSRAIYVHVHAPTANEFERDTCAGMASYLLSLHTCRTVQIGRTHARVVYFPTGLSPIFILFDFCL
jgi:hypothetical protein